MKSVILEGGLNHLQFEVRTKGGAACSDVDPMPHVGKLRIGKVTKSPQINTTSTTPNLTIPQTEENEPEGNQFDPSGIPMLENIFRNFQGTGNQSRIETLNERPTETIASSNIIINNASGGSQPTQPMNDEDLRVQFHLIPLV